MAITQQASVTQPDAAPLWLPRDEAVVVENAAARAADMVQGYRLHHRLAAIFLGSRWKVATTVSTAIAALVFIAVVPVLAGAGVGGMFKIAFYQSFTIGLMLLASTRVRSVSIGTIARYWLAGLFTVVMIAWGLNGPLSTLADRSEVWVTPVLEEVLKAAPFAVAILVGRRLWRHPGLTDLMILGFAVGGGYALYEDALWERAAVSGFEANAGLFVPSIFQPDGIFVVGHPVWTSIVGLAIGLIVLHRHHAPAVIAAVVALAAVVGDHMAINDGEGTLGFVRQLVFNGKLLAVIFLVGFAAAIVLDRRRLAATGARDHLFPSDRSHGRVPVDVEDEDLLAPFLTRRYRRLRNGMHTTASATHQQWPPRTEAHPAPVAELARLGRAADVAVGPGTSSYGWAPDPENHGGMRFVGPEGFTAYAAAETAAISTPKARAHAAAASALNRVPEFWQYFGVGVVAVALFVFARLVTAGDPSTALIETSLSLPDAPSSPALIRGVIGATAAALAIRGRSPAVLGAGAEVGPADDPQPDRPDECEA